MNNTFFDTPLDTRVHLRRMAPRIAPVPCARCMTASVTGASSASRRSCGWRARVSDPAITTTRYTLSPIRASDRTGAGAATAMTQVTTSDGANRCERRVVCG